MGESALEMSKARDGRATHHVTKQHNVWDFSTAPPPAQGTEGSKLCKADFFTRMLFLTFYKISFNMICCMKICNKNSYHFSCLTINEAKTQKQEFQKSLHVNFNSL